MTKQQLQVRNREIQDRMSELNDAAVKANREFNDDETKEWKKLAREKAPNTQALHDMMTDAEIEAHREKVSTEKALRELLSSVKSEKNVREITLYPSHTGDKGNITTSGAIAIKINDVLPTLNEGLGLPSSLHTVSGVTENEIWPVSVDDVEIEEVGETVALNDQSINFDHISPVQKRFGFTVPVSNMAIDSADFDLLAFVQQKGTLAVRKYRAAKAFSPADFSGIKSPFHGLTPAGTIALGKNAYKEILKAVAAFTNKGFDPSGVCIVIDADTEADLKATPRAAGQGGFVIENGLLAGYEYVVSHYINTQLQDGKLVVNPAKVIGIGFFEYLACQYHGLARLTIDSVSKAKQNITQVTFNQAYSQTDLSEYINGGNGTTQAFAVYSVTAPEGDPSITLSAAEASVAVKGTKTLTATPTPSGAAVTWLSDDTAVATVAAGVVTGVKAGTANIYAQITVDGQVYQAKAAVTVTA